jgi:uncharacterized protein YndB with AHSA1/START domain
MKTPSDHIVRITRRFDYPAARVFDAWLNPELAGRFLFATEDGEMLRTEIDARVGGRFMVVERRKGVEMEVFGEYLEIDRPNRLVFTFTAPKCTLAETTRVTVEVRPLGAGCELTLTHEVSADVARHSEGIESGWGTMFRKLAQAVTPGATPETPGNADYVTFPERAAVRFERLLPGPIERVWTYLIDPQKRATWFAGGPMELKDGGKVELHFDHNRISSEPTPKRDGEGGGRETHHGQIIRCEPPRLLSFTWLEDIGDHSETTFELTPKGQEVLLVVTHTHLPNRDMMVSVSGGWQTHVLILEDRLREREPRPFWTTYNQLEAEYEARVTPELAPE